MALAGDSSTASGRLRKTNKIAKAAMPDSKAVSRTPYRVKVGRFAIVCMEPILAILEATDKGSRTNVGNWPTEGVVFLR
jgi:hypothetical protein